MFIYNKFPCYMQIKKQESGVACLQIISKYYGRKYSQNLIKSRITEKKDIKSDFINAAENIGFEINKRTCTFQELNHSLTLPCTIFTQKSTFIVLYKIKSHSQKGNLFYVSDPSFGHITYTESEFDSLWINPGHLMGDLFTLHPTSTFHSNYFKEENKISLKDYFPFFLSNKKYIFQLIGILLTISLFNFILPFLTQSIVDNGINNKDIHFVISVFAAQFMIMLGQQISEYIRSLLSMHISTRINISLTSNFLNKIMNLPMAFFDSKNLGEIMSRINDNTRIQTFISTTIFSMLISLFTFFTFFFILFDYSFTIVITFLTGSTLHILWSKLLLKKRKKLDYRRFYENSSNQNNLMQLLNSMQEIKQNNSEDYFRWEWEKVQVNLYKISQKNIYLNQIQQMGGFLINNTKNILISCMAAFFVIRGEMTLGMMMAMQYVIGQLNIPINQLLNYIQNTQDTKISLERIRELYNQEDEDILNKSKIQSIPLNNSIELKRVGFKYWGNSNITIQHINLHIPSGKTTAIVGDSGCGKSTILKLILGYYKPNSGIIYLGEKPLDIYSIKSWRSQCGIVSQDSFVFSDTILRNIIVGDTDPDMDKVYEAIKLANLEEYIESLPLGYYTKIGMEGVGLSSGQKQRLLIARVLYKNPQFIFLDEATNALDVNNEHLIMKNLRKYFKNKTLIIVAHRLSTIRNADNIVVLKKGTIIEQGTHEQLIERQGEYHSLVNKQMESYEKRVAKQRVS